MRNKEGVEGEGAEERGRDRDRGQREKETARDKETGTENEMKEDLLGITQSAFTVYIG